MTPKPNPHRRAVEIAQQDYIDLGNLFAKFGGGGNSSGFVDRAYRNAGRAMATALTEPDPHNAVIDVMDNLRTTVKAGLASRFKDAQEMGATSAGSQLAAYGIDVLPDQSDFMDLSGQYQAAIDAVLADIETQEAKIRALVLTMADPVLILGDKSRQGVLRAGDVLVASLFWVGALFNGAWDWNVRRNKHKGFDKQAVAGIDERTTDCCLHVHGQVVGLNNKFHLTGTPRFADYLDGPPFHWWCRTSTVLYLKEYDDGLTDEMTKSAAIVLAERSRGVNKVRHPADAFA
jgi:hypothetical protein